MKYLIVFSCLLVVAYGLPPEIVQKIKETFTELGGQCKTEVGATDDDIAVLKSHQVPTTQSGKCFLACMDKKLGFQDAAGKIDKEGSRAKIAQLKPFDEELYGKVQQICEACLAEVTDAADECETAANMMVCVHKEHARVGLAEMDF